MYKQNKVIMVRLLQDLKVKEQEIEDKIREGKEKQIEMRSKGEAKKKALNESTELTKEESDKISR